ncbi:phosphatase domain-containing protein [Curtobacterium sp. 20TX0008]|uniref:phosphatase domain-containing protein n=1 Tax=Curtobacterium sp. 20TX0008 TaxID=3022018 RepID=UPI0023302AA5|nr:hypothetical protein [Curtobacterium sp. 20TX0008]MDB6425933.1 hypothetical protein [Curtobacterium sp. 20TX0008]
MTDSPVALRDAVIFDVDGTLVDVAPIRHYLHPNRAFRDFDAFHRVCVFCNPHTDVVSAARALHDGGVSVLVVTARRRRYERFTRARLTKHDVPFAKLFMRDDDDRRLDADVKWDILERIRRCYRVTHAYDDNPSVIALWASEQIPVTVVPGWDDPIAMPAPRDAEEGV